MMQKLYLLKDEGASLFNEEHFVLVCRWYLWGYMLCGFFPPVCFCTRCLFLACCSHSDSAVCPLCFIGSVCSVLLALHFMCQNEARAHSLLNSNIPTFTISSQKRSLSLHTAMNISELDSLVFHLYFGYKVGPTVSFPFYTIYVKIFVHGKCSTVQWFKVLISNLIEPRHLSRNGL